MTTFHISTRRGFAALLTSILLSATLTGAVLMVQQATSDFYNTSVLKEYKVQSKLAAISCVFLTAKVMLQDELYTVPVNGDVFDLDDVMCVIVEVVPLSVQQKVVTVEGWYKNTVTKAKATINLSAQPVQIENFVELE